MLIDAIQEEEYVRRLLNERFWPSTDGKLSALNSISTTGRYNQFPKGTYSSDYEWFFGNREMEDLLANIFVWKKENVADEQALINRLEKMIHIIDVELNEK
jgi:hypothetical protein